MGVGNRVERSFGPVQAGIATRDITPPVGTSLSGFSYGRTSTAVRDQLRATALALVDDSGVPAVLVSTDLLAMTVEQIAAVRTRVQSVVRDSLLVLTHSHTHSGPSIGLLRDAQVASEAFLGQFVDSVASVVLEAVATAAPARIFLGTSLCDIGVNRRSTSSGIELAPNPDGPCDRDVVVLRVDRCDGVAIACWFRMSAHPITLGGADTRISGDWPAEAERLLKDSVGCKEALFAQGCCGDVNPTEMGDEQALLHISRRAASAVGQAWRSVSPLEPDQWRSVLRIVDLPTVRLPAADELPARLEVQALRLGQLAIVGFSAEPFSRIAAWVTRLLPETTTPVVLGYTNGCFGYLPDEEAVEGTEGQRGYEVDGAPYWFRTPVLSPEAVDVAKDVGAEAVSALLDA